jgi:hypothetical protein
VLGVQANDQAFHIFLAIRVGPEDCII